jgi:uncharacterized protein YegP (UPF0339 family)
MTVAGYFELNAAAGSQFRFNLKAGNNQVILSSELYKTKQSALDGIASVKQNAVDDARYQRKTAKDDSAYFTLVAGNGQAVGRSEMYSSAAAMENGIASVKANAPTAAVKDLSAG